MTTSDIEHLFRTHYVEMHRMAILLLRDDDVAKDIVHDAFESLLSSNQRGVSRQYLLMAVRNRCLNYIRGLSVKQRMKELYAIGEHEIETEDWPDDETVTAIRSTVENDLSEPCRRVVNLRFIDGKSYKDIAALLDISEVAVYKHLRHAIDILRQKLS